MYLSPITLSKFASGASQFLEKVGLGCIHIAMPMDGAEVP